MSTFSFDGLDPVELLERLTLYAYELFGCFPNPHFEPVVRGSGDGPEDLALATFTKFLDPNDDSIKWKRAERPTLWSLLAFLKKVLQNDFLDLMKSKRYQTTVIRDGKAQDGKTDLSLDDFASNDETPEVQVIRKQQREILLGKFANEPDLGDVLEAQLEPEAYNAYTNKDLASLLSTNVSDIENRKKRLSLRLRKLQKGERAER